ncbi:MAG: hypothetical protein OSB24_05090 [Woeseiaceae bacterium]|jgi:hypothetical protein|nr:hypothetical protein [Woeseiaceae bacterium]|tara:strand:+ start:210 stop:458 length:249 start_codon:yes stop_codon:yes gene_type:complete
MKKTIIIILFFLLGLLVLPFLFFVVNDFVFGKYGGEGFTGFYNEHFTLMKNGNPAAWFITLSPYLVYLSTKITIQICRNFKQ